jgi:hypothetical protein
VVETLLRRRHGEVGEHAKVVQLRAELAALAARVKQRSYENQLRYRNKRDEKKDSET